MQIISKQYLTQVFANVRMDIMLEIALNRVVVYFFVMILLQVVPNVINY